MISRHYSGWVAPFGLPQIKGHLLLPVDYRSMSRPSSPLNAKASTIRPYFLDPSLFLIPSVVKEQIRLHRLKTDDADTVAAICVISVIISVIRFIKSRPANLVVTPKCQHLLLLLRKEVIQPQVPLWLPCYDFTPITGHTVGSCLPCGLAHLLLVQQTFVV